MHRQGDLRRPNRRSMRGMARVAALGAVVALSALASARVVQQFARPAEMFPALAVPADVDSRFLPLRANLAGAQGHPSFAAPIEMPSGARGGPVGAEPEPELVSGDYVNFESPPVRPLALGPGGNVLYAVNTPNRTLHVFTTAGDELNEVASIPVGLEPVAVAVQPNTARPIVWVANYLSDSVSIVDVGARRVVRTIEVGDEPVNILFNESGSHAFVVTQGPDEGQINTDPGSLATPLAEGTVAAIDTATNQIVSRVRLPGNTPRAAAYRNGQIVVAALFSGNNSTVVGEPVFLQIVPPLPPGVGPFIPVLWIAQFFSQTAQIFADSAQLSPWPDPETSPNHNVASPLVHRIVPDAGEPGDWNDIVDVLADDNGDPDPAMVALFKQEFETLIRNAFGDPNFTLLNAEEVIATTIHDVKDTADHDLFVIDATDPTDLTLTPGPGRILGGVGTTLTGLAVHPVDGRVFVSNLQALNLTRLEPQVNGHFIDHQVVIVDLANDPPTITPTDLHADVADFNDVSAVNPAARAGSLANPLDLVFNADGSRAYVAAFGVGRVGALDGASGAVVGRVDVGRGPRGLALDAARDRLYVLSRTDMTIQTVDVSSDAMTVVGEHALFNPEPARVRNGRDFLYSTRFSNNFGSSCAMCHIDGHLDFLAWDLGDPAGDLQPGPPNLENLNGDPLLNHPVKGPMVTLSLKGLDRHEPFHWRGDRPTFQDFNVAFEGLLGGEQLSDEEMDAYTDFIMTVQYPPSFYRHRDNTFKDPRAVTGFNQFIGAGIPPNQQSCANCNTCHMVSHDGAQKIEGVEGDAGLNLIGIFAQLQLVTQMRGIDKKFAGALYNGVGTIHDGREEIGTTVHPLMTFLETFFPGMPVGLKVGLISFVTAFPTNVMPIVGDQVLLAANPTPLATADILQMIGQHDQVPSRCDVIVDAMINDEHRGYYLVATDFAIVFQSDMGEAVTLNELLSLLDSPARNTLLFTAVPPGSGRRMGIDADLDCLSNGLDPQPLLAVPGDMTGEGIVDLVDFSSFAACFSGPGATLDPLGECGCRADLDKDGDVDLNDFTSFAVSFSG